MATKSAREVAYETVRSRIITMELKPGDELNDRLLAQELGITAQAVSKWETGTADPSTSNLLALAKLFGVSAEELLRSVEKAR